MVDQWVASSFPLTYAWTLAAAPDAADCIAQPECAMTPNAVPDLNPGAAKFVYRANSADLILPPSFLSLGRYIVTLTVTDSGNGLSSSAST